MHRKKKPQPHRKRQMKHPIKKTTLNSLIFLRETFSKTTNFLHRTYQNFKSILYTKYQKLPETTLSHPMFSCGTNDYITMQELDSFYRAFSEQWDCNHKNRPKRKKGKEMKDFAKIPPKQVPKRDEKSTPSPMKTAKNTINNMGKEEEEKDCTESAENLTQKMKELEMMDVNDMDNVLDVEEVLFYYSRLNCQAYIDIVDRFFMDMYREFHITQPQQQSATGAVSLGSSKRMVGSGNVQSPCSMREKSPLGH